MLFYQELSAVAGRRMLATISGFRSFSSLSQQSAAWQRIVCLQPAHQTAIRQRSLPLTASFFVRHNASTPAPHDSRKGDLVYVGTLARMVRFVKFFSLSTSAVGVSLQPFLYDQVSNLHWALATMVGGVAGFFVFVTPVLLHIVTKRYVTMMYLNRDSGVFTATTYSLLLREKEHSFTADDVKVPTVPGLFTTAKIKDKVPLFLDPNLFIDRQAYIQMMKYDEPLDWEIPEQPDTKKPSQ